MKMNGARILVEELIHQGVEVIFGYPGGAVLNIYDELYLASDRIRHVLSAHEQGAAHAADGYARASGKTGVVLATSGPGATNLVTGIANAYLDSVPMVAITGNVAVSSLGKDSFQEVDIVGITQPIVKHNFMVRDIKDLQPDSPFSSPDASAASSSTAPAAFSASSMVWLTSKASSIRLLTFKLAGITINMARPVTARRRAKRFKTPEDKNIPRIPRTQAAGIRREKAAWPVMAKRNFSSITAPAAIIR